MTDAKIGIALEATTAGGNPVVCFAASQSWRQRAPRRRWQMQSLALRIVLESDFGSVHELPKAGSPLENPYVYDASARDMKAMASDGLVRIVDELHFDGDGLISRLTFQRLR